MTEQKCKIKKYVRKVNLDGNVFEEQNIEVYGNSLDECKKIFDEKWKE